ncbi:MAG: acyltransferase family protein [Lachnotalea sp.]
MNRQNNRNYSIEFWRFIFIGAICIMHFSNSYFGVSPYFDDAYVATEFFFIVSGYLLMKSFNKNKKNKICAWKFTINKVLRLYPYYILSFIAIFIFVMINDKASIMDWIINLGGSVWELLFLQISGLKCFTLFNYPTWYISAMLIVGYLIYALLELFEETCIKIIMPVAILVIYCFFSRESGSIDVWGGSTILGVSDALMRAFAGMSLGAICYWASDALKQMQLNKRIKIILSIVELLVFSLALGLMSQAGHTQLDFYIIGLLAVAVTVSFSEQTFLYRLFDSSFFSWIGKISYPLFLNQIFVINIMGVAFVGLGYTSGIIVFLLLLVLVSFIEIAIVEGMKKIFRKY